MAVSNLRDGDRQIAHEEGEKDGEHHLGDPPLVAARLRVARVFDRAALVLVQGAGSRARRAVVLSHALFRTVEWFIWDQLRFYFQ